MPGKQLRKWLHPPIVEQEGELCFSLYTPEADSIVTSTGIIIHVGTMGAAINS